jgi:penicillin-binding protein 1A
MEITAPVGPQKKVRRRSGFIRRLVGFTFAFGMVVFLVAASVAGFILWNVSKDLPDYEALAKYEPPVTTRIYANDGNLIAEFARERRIYVPITAVPPRVIQAFLSAEDKNFYQHGGLDIQGILRAAITNFGSHGGQKMGASTITQQVAKNFLLSSEQTFDRKLKELLVSVRIERAFTKDHILELYLNEIYLGSGSYGVAAAAQTYWDKSLSELTIADCAYLATLPKAPSSYSPFKSPERAIARRNWVIDRMVENGYVTRDEGDKAKAQPLGVTLRKTGPRILASEFFAEEVRRNLLDQFGEDQLYGGGLVAHTTLDPTLQRIARKTFVDGLVAYDHRHGWRGPVKNMGVTADWAKLLATMNVWSDIEPWRLAVVLQVNKDKATIGLRPNRASAGGVERQAEQGEIPFGEMQWARPSLKNGMGASPRSASEVLKPGDVIYVSPREPKDGQDSVEGQWSLQQIPAVGGGFVAMDPHTGRVLALVGGFSFAQSQFNRAVQALRQPGSTLKPLIYTAALDNGYTPASIVIDGPITINRGPGLPPWRPKNYESGSFAGPSTLRFGIEHSRNLMTVRLSNDMGMPVICEYTRRFGVYDNLMPILPMALGAGETTLLKMVNAYGIIDNGGKAMKATLIDYIQDRYGRVIWRHDQRNCDQCAAQEWNEQDEPKIVDDRKQIIDPMTAYQMTHIMEGVIERGTAQKLKVLQRPIAGKTGTTNDEKDAWFIGFTPDLVVGAYIGFDNPAPLGHGETGGNVSAPAVRDFFKLALGDQPAIPFRVPSGIRLVRVNLKSGLPTSASDPQGITEAFKPNQGPLDATSADNQETAAISGGDQPPIDPTQVAPPEQAAASPSVPIAPAAADTGQAPAKPPVKAKPKSVAQAAKPVSQSAAPPAPQPPANQDSPNFFQRAFKGSGGLY